MLATDISGTSNFWCKVYPCNDLTLYNFFVFLFYLLFSFIKAFITTFNPLRFWHSYFMASRNVSLAALFSTCYYICCKPPFKKKRKKHYFFPNWGSIMKNKILGLVFKFPYMPFQDIHSMHINGTLSLI